MYRFLTKYGTMMAFGLGLLITVVGLFIIMGGIEDFNSLPDEEKGTTSIFNFGLGGAIILVILCAILMLGFGVFHVASDPKGAVKFIVGLVVLVGLVVVFAMTAQADTGKVAEAIQDGELTQTTSNWITGGLSATLILLAGATLAFIYSEIRNLFR